MGSGNTREIINTLERAVSNDFNRGWSFGVKDTHELVRNRNRAPRGDFFRNPGVDAVYTAAVGAGDHIVAQDCLYGLMVRPDNATFLLVDPGEAGFFVAAFPNSSSDDSDYIAIADAGLTDPAILTFLANAGPGIRWDIVECQPTEILAVGGSSSRDIYNPATGQFTPTTVEKVRQGVLTYRIRRGVQGAGVPNPDPDWMPLAAVHVRTDSTSFLNSDVYDLRPLISERVDWSSLPHISTPEGQTSYRVELYEAEINVEIDTEHQSCGYFRSHYGGYHSGGVLRCNTPASSAANFGVTTRLGSSYARFNWHNAANRSASFTTGADHLIVMAAVFPRGYPRWVRYSQAALVPDATNRLKVSGRLPQGPRGILVVVDATASTHFENGVILGTGTSILPATFGEVGGQTMYGHAVAAAVWDDSASRAFPGLGGTTDKKYSFTDWISATVYQPAVSLDLGVLTGVLPGPPVWTLGGTIVQTETIVPRWARAILIEVDILFPVAAAPGIVNMLRVIAGISGPTAPGFTVAWNQSHVTYDADEVGTIELRGTFWMPLWRQDPFDGTGGPATGISFEGIATVGKLSGVPTGTMKIRGYQF